MRYRDFCSRVKKGIHGGIGMGPGGRILATAAVIALVSLAQTDRGFAAFENSSNTLRLELSGITNGSAYLILHGTQPGTYYEIFGKADLSDGSWAPICGLAGLTNQDWTPFICNSGVDKGFFWARVQLVQGGMRLEIPADTLAVADQMTLVVRGTVQGNPYEVLTKLAMTDAIWTQEQQFFGGTGGSTRISLSLRGRTHLFVWAASSDAAADNASWTSDVSGLTADYERPVFLGSVGGAVTADTTRTSTDTAR